MNSNCEVVYQHGMGYKSLVDVGFLGTHVQLK